MSKFASSFQILGIRNPTTNQAVTTSRTSGIHPKFIKLKCLSSYVNWPESANQSPSRLAEAFFQYTTYKDSVVCPECDFEKDNWQKTDKPLKIHRERSRNCPLVHRDIEADGEQEEGGVTEEDGEPEIIEQKYSDVNLAQNARNARESKGRRRLRMLGDVGAMKRENIKIDAQLKCIDCKRNGLQTLFLPCRHLVSCEVCADVIDYCSLCSTKIMGTVRTYLI